MKRFQIRNEFFGSIAYDFVDKNFIAFDRNSTRLLKALLKFKIEEKPFKIETSFLNKLNHKGLLYQTKPNYYFLNNNTCPSVISAPLRLHLAYTSKCNLNCSHCFAKDYNDKNEKELSFKEKVNILDQMKAMGVNEILIGGGEPFVETDFLEYLEECKMRRINTKVFTNGLLLTDHIINKLKDLNLGYLSLSIDGACDESYSKIRGSKNLKLAINNLKLLTSKCSFPIVMQITVTKTNLNEVDAILELAENTNVDRLKIRPIKPGGNVLNHPEIIAEASEFLSFIKTAQEIWSAKYKNSFELDYSWGNARLYFDESQIFVEGIPQPHKGYGCLAGKISMFIDPFGNVFPCVFLVSYLGSTSFENILQNSLTSIWKAGPTFKKLRNLQSNLNCLNCKSYDICRGGCIARILYEGLKINEPDPWCLEKYFPCDI